MISRLATDVQFYLLNYFKHYNFSQNPLVFHKPSENECLVKCLKLCWKQLEGGGAEADRIFIGLQAEHISVSRQILK